MEKMEKQIVEIFNHIKDTEKNLTRTVRAFGIQPTTFYQWLKHKRMPSYAHIQRIKALHQELFS